MLSIHFYDTKHFGSLSLDGGGGGTVAIVDVIVVVVMVVVVVVVVLMVIFGWSTFSSTSLTLIQ